MAFYMPDTSLMKSTSPTEALDFYLKLWELQLPVKEDELDDQDPRNRLKRFKSLIVDKSSLRESVRLSILERLDAEFQSSF